jgi:predicted enzyme related to lactoylglutathione lyase
MAVQPIVHVEIPASDPKASSEFYNKVFGWEITHAEQFNYYMFRAGNGPGGGWISTSGEHAAQPGQLLVYLDSDDIDADLARIEQSGGTVVEPKMEIPGQGWLAVWTDPSGNRLGLFQYLKQG